MDLDFASWRIRARHFIQSGVRPEQVGWGESLDLFAATPSPNSQNFLIPKEFLNLARVVAQHHFEARWQLLYEILWRLRFEQPRLLEDVAHPLVHQARQLEKQVRRDCHKMTAFVRFEKIETAEGPARFIAWYEPDFDILPLTLDFFVRRFASMHWTILTPSGGAEWDGTTLQPLAGPFHKPAASADACPELWRDYYSSIFNPARIKVKAMKNEMPTRFWKNLPEAALIPQLLDAAPRRMQSMVAQSRAAIALPPPPPRAPDLATLNRELKNCHACELCHQGCQSVAGEGPRRAKIMIVGEAPGDQEDRQGKVFVGPAGQLLRKTLHEIGASAESIYFTNAVKHFRYVYDGKLRLHRTPLSRHIKACRPWLKAELELVRPERIICLGASAAESVLGFKNSVLKARGEAPRRSPLFDAPALITLHPSALLRAHDPSVPYHEYFRDDLRRFLS